MTVNNKILLKIYLFVGIIKFLMKLYQVFLIYIKLYQLFYIVQVEKIIQYTYLSIYT